MPIRGTAGVTVSVAAIKAVTDLIPDAGALDDLATILAAVDTEIAAILTDTGTSIPALLNSPASGLGAIIGTVAYYGNRLDDPATGLTALMNTLRAYGDRLDDPATGFTALMNTLAAVIILLNAIPTTAMRGTDGAALVASGWDATLATALDNYTAARAGYLDNIDTKAMGRLQVAVASWDGHFGNGGGGTDVLFTVTDQDIIVEALIVKMTTVDLTDDDWTGLSIQDDYGTTPHVFIAAAAGVKANLAVNAQLAWTGAVLVDSGQTIGATAIAADANEDAKIIVIIKYRAVVDGGYVV